MIMKPLFIKEWDFGERLKASRTSFNLKQIFAECHIPSATLEKRPYTLNIKCFPHSSRSAIGVAESADG